MKIVLAGAGAFGLKHLDALKLIDGVEVVSLVGRQLEPTRAAAEKYGVRHVTTELGRQFELPGSGVPERAEGLIDRLRHGYRVGLRVKDRQILIGE